MQTGGRQDRRGMRVPRWPPDEPAGGAAEDVSRDRAGQADHQLHRGGYGDAREYARAERRDSGYGADDRRYVAERPDSGYGADDRQYARAERRDSGYGADDRRYAVERPDSGYGADDHRYARTERRDSGYGADDRRYAAERRDSGYGADDRRYARTERPDSGYGADDRRYAAERHDSGYGADDRRYAAERRSEYGAYSRRRGGADGRGADDAGFDFSDGDAPDYGGAHAGDREGGQAFERMSAAARRTGARLRQLSDGRRAPRRTRTAPDAPDERETAVFGGREHDNIHAADARPGVGRAPIVAMILVVVLLVVFVPMLVQAWNRRAALGGNAISVQGAVTSGVSITAQPGSAIPTPTAAPEATPQPDASAQAQTAAPEATASGLIVSQYTGRTLDRNRPAVALTFDDGPSEQTGRILDALAANGGLGTFFPIGERVASGEYADVMRRQWEMGCLVGTHMYSHTKLTELTAEAIAQELAQCVAAHQAAGGSAPELARAPYGQVSDEVLSALGLPLVNWSLNSNDWQTQDADRIYNDVMNAVQDGDIVLFHDLKDFTVAALERIAPALTAQGYQLVTVQELFELKGQQLEAGRLYAERVTADGA